MRIKVFRRFTEATMVVSSGGFLAWYVWVKVVTCPWNL